MQHLDSIVARVLLVADFIDSIDPMRKSVPLQMLGAPRFRGEVQKVGRVVRAA
jgi:hypothetical protein